MTSSTFSHLGTASALLTFNGSCSSLQPRRSFDLGYMQKPKCQFQLNILTAIISVSVTFADLLYMPFLVLPPRHARGLGVADLDTLEGLALPI
jgi:hypothetical protein